MSEVEFENTRETGDLELSKKLISERTADADQEFTFTVKLTGAPITGTYGDMEFTNGEAEVKLKGGESATAAHAVIQLMMKTKKNTVRKNVTAAWSTAPKPSRTTSERTLNSRTNATDIPVRIAKKQSNRRNEQRRKRALTHGMK